MMVEYNFGHSYLPDVLIREGSNEGSRIRTSGSYERPELYVKII